MRGLLLLSAAICAISGGGGGGHLDASGVPQVTDLEAVYADAMKEQKPLFVRFFLNG